MSLLYLSRRYASPLPPELLLRRLYRAIALPPASPWRRVGYWFQRGCKGYVKPTTATFEASVPHGKGSGPEVAGRWWGAPTATSSLVELRIRPSLGQVLGLVFVLFIWLTMLLSSGALLHPLKQWLLLTFGLIPLLMLVDAQWSLHKAARYFREALLLTEVPTE